MKRLLSLPLIFLACSLAFAQASPSPAPYSLAQNLGQLQQTAQQIVTDLGLLRVSKWKVDERVKSETQSNIESLQRNLTGALPALIQQVQANPSSVAAGVRLYRNLNAVYDVLASVSETTGAFGAKDEYRDLATNTAALDTSRRQIADQLEQLATAKEQEFARLQEVVRAQQAAAQAAPPKKVIVDDEAPAPKKKTSKTTKKKTAAKTEGDSQSQTVPQQTAPKPQ